MRRAKGAAALQQLRRRKASCGTGRFQRSGLAAVAVRLVEQLPDDRRKLGWQRAGLQFVGHAGNAQRLLALLFEAGEGGLENLARRPAKTALALAVEVDRRRLQGQQQGRRFDRVGDVTEVLVGKVEEGELAVAEAFPEEVLLDAAGQRLGLIEQGGRCRLTVAQEDVCRLDLAALSGSGLDLQGAVIVEDNGGRPESPVFFV